MPMDTTVSTPATRARRRASIRSGSNAGRSRWAWESVIGTAAAGFETGAEGSRLCGSSIYGGPSPGSVAASASR